jgi:hypothetical protein
MVESMIIPLVYPIFIMFITFFVFEHFIQAFVYILDILEEILNG